MGELLWAPGSHFMNFEEYAIKISGITIHRTDFDYFIDFMTWDLCLKKISNMRNSNQLSSDEYTGESIMNTNNFRDIKQNLKT
jgi:hypothetical protein